MRSRSFFGAGDKSLFKDDSSSGVVLFKPLIFLFSLLLIHLHK
jgi:hypothetical protein